MYIVQFDEVLVALPYTILLYIIAVEHKFMKRNNLSAYVDIYFTNYLQYIIL